MNKPCARITLDLQQASTPTFVAVKKSDIGREIRITLSDGGFPYEISADCYAVLTGTKPDGNILYNHCDIEGNTIVYTVTEQTTAAAGRMKAEVKLYGADDQLVTSATFRIIIDGTVYTDDKVESSPEFSALNQLMNQVLEIIRNHSDESISVSIVTELPKEDISTSTLYLVKDTEKPSNIYTEYLYVNGEWEIIGSQQLDLTGYIKTINGEGPDQNGDFKMAEIEVKNVQKTVTSVGGTITNIKGVSIEVTKQNPDGTLSMTGGTVWNGTDGVSPHIGDNGNWFVGDQDTGVSAGGNNSGGNVAYDEAQKLTDEEKAQARENIGILEPLIGKADDIKPKEVQAALQEGRDIVITYTDGTYGDIEFTGFSYTESSYYVIATCITSSTSNPLLLQLTGHIAFNKWLFHSDILAKFGDTAGGSSLGITGATVGQTVKISAVDENGKPTEWETVDFPEGGGATPDWNAAEGEPGYILNRPFGDFEVAVFPEAVVTFEAQEALGGMNAAIIQFANAPIIGNEYIVKFGETEYTCTYIDASGNGDTCVMGNLGIAGMGEDTGEPFMLYVEQGIPIIIPMGGVASVAFSIRGVQAVPIAPEYAPEAALLDFVEAGLPSVNTEQSVSVDLSDFNMWNKLNTAFEKGTVKIRFALTAKYKDLYSGNNNDSEVSDTIVTATANITSAVGSYPTLTVFLGNLIIGFLVTDANAMAFAKPLW